MIVYLNDRFVDEQHASISIFDSGFLYGEGIFTTLRLYGGTAPDLDAHWQRLQQQAATLEIPFPLSLDETKIIIDGLVQKNGIHLLDARVRITVTRDGDPDNPLQLIAPTQCRATVLIRVSPLPASIDHATVAGIAVITLGPAFLRNHLPNLKSLNYLPSIMALREAHKSGCAEAIMTNEKGHLTEGSVSNIFLVKDGDLFTPADDGTILAGLTRRHVIALAAKNNLTCHETTLTMDDLENADEVFLCNSIRRIVPVIRIDKTSVGKEQPGPVTLRIQQFYDAAMRP